jgi:hypothetical protein
MKPPRRRQLARSDTGAALILVLAFLALFGLLAVALAGFASASLRAAGTVVEIGADQRDAEDGTQQALARILADWKAGAANGCLDIDVGSTDDFTYQAASGNNVWVRCETLGESDEEIPGGGAYSMLIRNNLPDFRAIDKRGNFDVELQGNVIIGQDKICLRKAFPPHEVPPPCNDTTSPDWASIGPMVILPNRNGTQATFKSPANEPCPVPAVETDGTISYYDAKLLFAPGTTGRPGGWLCDGTDPTSFPPYAPPGGLDALPLNPAPTLTGCAGTGTNFSCIRVLAPGRYTAAPNLSPIDRARPCGTCPITWAKIRAVHLAPTGSGVYYFDGVNVTLKQSSKPVSLALLMLPGVANSYTPPVVGGTLANANQPATPPVVDRCVSGQPGVELVFRQGFGLYHGVGFNDPAEVTLCPSRSAQLATTGSGRSGIVLYQLDDPALPPGSASVAGAQDNWAVLSDSLNNTGGGMVLKGFVYAPDGYLNLRIGNQSIGPDMYFARGIVAWGLVLRPWADSTLVAQASEGLIVKVRLTIRVCDTAFAPGPTPDDAPATCTSSRPDTTAEFVRDDAIIDPAEKQAFLTKWLPG